MVKKLVVRGEDVKAKFATIAIDLPDGRQVK